MRKVKYFLTIAVPALLIFAFASCKSSGDDGPSAQELMSKRLASTWIPVSSSSGSFLIGDDDLTPKFSTFEVSFGTYDSNTKKGTFSSQNDHLVFKGVTGWSFESPDTGKAEQIKLEGAVYIHNPVTVEVSDDGATLKLTFSTKDTLPPIIGAPDARTASITGDYVVTLKK